MKKIIFLTTITLLISCSDSVSPEKDNSIYFNSFEELSDFEGWSGINELSWNSDVAAEGGEKSVLISGGCVVPHAQYIFQNDLLSGYYTIECWGKAVKSTQGGMVSLNYSNSIFVEDSSVFLGFTDSIWTHKISEPLYVPKDKLLKIQMIAGGIISSAMLIDNICVRKTK